MEIEGTYDLIHGAGCLEASVTDIEINFLYDEPNGVFGWLDCDLGENKLMNYKLGDVTSLTNVETGEEIEFKMWDC